MGVASDILTFWFETTDLTQELERRDIWFKSIPEFDDAIRDNFLDLHEQAAAGELDHLKETPADCVALLIALDQFPRNLFRGSARAFASDEKAREIARYALAQGHGDGLATWPRMFIYLPFEHSENIDDQRLSVALYQTTGVDTAIAAATGHWEVIEKYGRFPFRNEALGRENTPAETEFLKDPPPWGKTKAEAEEMARLKAETEAAAAKN